MSDTRADLMQLQTFAQQSPPKKCVIISDAGRDHDDEVALTVAAGLSKIGLLDIEAVVANLKPAQMRARLIKGILTTVGLPNVPVGVGTAVNENSVPQPYEFNASYLSEEQTFADGQSLLKTTFENAEDHSLILLLISGLTDANIFLSANKALAKQKLQKIVIMGGALTDHDDVKRDEMGRLQPDESYNHKVDMPSAKSFYQIAQDENIPLMIVSRFAAMACAMTPQFFMRLAEENSPIGKRLCAAQADSIRHLWTRVFMDKDDVRREGLPPYCNKEWFLKTFTNNADELQNFTVNDDIWPHVTKLNAYDPIALLAAVVPELFHPLKVITDQTEHAIAGINAANPGVDDPEKIRGLLTALAVQGLAVTIEKKNENNNNKICRGLNMNSTMYHRNSYNPENEHHLQIGEVVFCLKQWSSAKLMYEMSLTYAKDGSFVPVYLSEKNPSFQGPFRFNRDTDYPDYQNFLAAMTTSSPSERERATALVGELWTHGGAFRCYAEAMIHFMPVENEVSAKASVNRKFG